MSKLSAYFSIICAVWMCIITSAQDRGFASAIEWSLDGETIAIASSAGVWFFDTEFNETGYVQIRQGRSPLSPRSLDWNSTSDLLVVAFPLVSEIDRPIQVIDVNKLRVITEIVPPWLRSQVVWHPEDNLIAAGSWVGEAFVWDALTGEALFEFEENDEQTNFSWNSTMAVCWFTKSIIAVITQWETYVVDVELNDSLQSFDIRNHFYPPVCHDEHRVIHTPNGMFHVEAGAYSETYKPWRDENDFSVREAIFPHSSDFIPEVQDRKFSPDGSKLVFNEEGCLISVFDTRNGRLLALIRGGIYFVQEPYTPFLDSLAWHPDGSRFAAVGQFGGIRVWDGETFELLQRYDGFETGYGELRGKFNYYSEESLDQIEAYKKKCIEALNSELPKM